MSNLASMEVATRVLKRALQVIERLGRPRDGFGYQTACVEKISVRSDSLFLSVRIRGRQIFRWETIIDKVIVTYEPSKLVPVLEAFDKAMLLDDLADV